MLEVVDGGMLEVVSGGVTGFCRELTWPSARRVDGLFFSNPPVGLRSSA
jgi:hypothetical protein